MQNADLENVDEPALRKILFFLNFQDVKSLRRTSRLLKSRVELLCKQILLLTARDAETLMEIARLSHVQHVKFTLKQYNLMCIRNRKIQAHLSDEEVCRLLKTAERVLRTVDLERTVEFSGEGLAELNASFDNLSELNLARCRTFSDPGLNNILNGCRAHLLTDLDIAETSVSGEGLACFDFKLDCLKRLNLEKCMSLTDAGLCELLAFCGANLESLNLCATNIGGEGLAGLQAELTHLQDLNLYQCHNLTDAGFHELIAHCGNNLRDLNIGETKITVEEALHGLIDKLAKLECLGLYKCLCLTDNGLRMLLGSCGATLRELNLHRTTLVTGEGLQGWTASRLEVLYVMQSAVEAGRLIHWIEHLLLRPPRLRQLILNEDWEQEDMERIQALLPDFACFF